MPSMPTSATCCRTGSMLRRSLHKHTPNSLLPGMGQRGNPVIGVDELDDLLRREVIALDITDCESNAQHSQGARRTQVVVKCVRHRIHVSVLLQEKSDHQTSTTRTSAMRGLDGKQFLHCSSTSSHVMDTPPFCRLVTNCFPRSILDVNDAHCMATYGTQPFRPVPSGVKQSLCREGNSQ